MHTFNWGTSSMLYICNIYLNLGLGTSYPVSWSWNDPSFPLQESLPYTSSLNSILCLVHEITQCDSAQLTFLLCNAHQTICTLHRYCRCGLPWKASWKRTSVGQEITRRWVPWAISICFGWRETIRLETITKKKDMCWLKEGEIEKQARWSLAKRIHQDQPRNEI